VFAISAAPRPSRAKKFEKAKGLGLCAGLQGVHACGPSPRNNPGSGPPPRQARTDTVEDGFRAGSPGTMLLAETRTRLSRRVPQQFARQDLGLKKARHPVGSTVAVGPLAHAIAEWAEPAINPGSSGRGAAVGKPRSNREKAASIQGPTRRGSTAVHGRGHGSDFSMAAAFSRYYAARRQQHPPSPERPGYRWSPTPALREPVDQTATVAYRIASTFFTQLLLAIG